MTNTKQFFTKFQELKGASFIGIQNYENKFGELSNYNIITQIDVMNAKRNDLEKLKGITDSDLSGIAIDTGIDIDVVKTALSELIVSAEKNISANRDDHTVASKAQAETYLHLTPAIKMHKETMDVYITGLIQNKTVIKEGEYPIVKSRPKTLAKKAIKKFAGLRMEKYRTLKLGKFDRIAITGDTLVLS